jgi:fluoride exporter
VREYAAPCPNSSYEDRCQLKSIIAIFIGAGLGALLRWWLGLTLNSHFPTIPPGTLAANLIGGYIIGLAVAFFPFSGLAPEWRLFVITGFCGGLTTFSTFSSEIVTLLQQDRSVWACGAAAVHLTGSVLMTLAGIGTVAWVKS